MNLRQEDYGLCTNKSALVSHVRSESTVLLLSVILPSNFSSALPLIKHRLLNNDPLRSPMKSFL